MIKVCQKICLNIQKLLSNVGQNVKAHCSVMGNVIFSCAQWCLLKNVQLECDSFRLVLLLLADLTPRPHLLYVLVSWFTYRVMYQYLV